jgi:hypothetical protein
MGLDFQSGLRLFESTYFAWPELREFGKTFSLLGNPFRPSADKPMISSSGVPGCGGLFLRLFLAAGFPTLVFRVNRAVGPPKKVDRAGWQIAAEPIL